MKSPKGDKQTEKQIQQLEAVSGTVTDAQSGKTLPGVNILVKGTSTGTSTNPDGHYEVSVPSLQDTLVFSFVGYQTRQVPISGRTGINVEMQSQAITGEEMVVVGYGTQKKVNLTGAISSVGSEEIEEANASSVTGAIQGRIPGVQITSTGGPGGSKSVRIRGIGTTGNNKPLYIVDGFPISSGDMGIPGSSENIGGLSRINPDDIESIEVLKDAASTAIYGARGANGVVLITTKRGSAGQPTVNIHSYTGFSEVSNKPDMLNAEELAKVANQLWINSGIKPFPEFASPQALGEGTNWLNAIFRRAPVSNINLSVSGGSDDLKARLSLGYLKQLGTLIETKHNRYNGRASVDFAPSNRLKFGGTLNFTYSKGKGLRNTGSHSKGIIHLAKTMFPNLGLNDVIGEDQPYATSQADNPVLRAHSQDFRVNDRDVNMQGYAKVNIVDDLYFRSQIGAEFNNDDKAKWLPTVNRGYFNRLQASLFNRSGRSSNYQIENSLHYKTQINKHSISAVLVQSAQVNYNNWISATGIDYNNEKLRVIDGSKASLRQAGGTGAKYKLASYVGRINYNFDNKYIFSASIRHDGSSRFGNKKKWGTFPSISGGWNISRERFMRNVSNLSNLKIRGSWGRSGSDQIGAFGYSDTYVLGTPGNNYILGTDQHLVVGASLSRPGNQDLKWETSEQVDIGMDIALFSSSLYSTIDYYKKRTKDMLVSLPVSLESGFSNAPNVNAGEVLNKGLEFQIGYRKQTVSFNWDISANFSVISNKVVSLGTAQPIVGRRRYGSSQPVTYTEVGQEIGYFKGLIVEGIYQTEDEIDKDFQPTAAPGDFKWRDIDGDGLVTDADRVKIGSPWPDFTYGANVAISYKNLDLNLVLRGIKGAQIFNAKKATSVYAIGGGGIHNARKSALKSWTPEKGGDTVPRQIIGDPNGNYSEPSTYFVEDGDYLRIQNVRMGYSFPSFWGRGDLNKLISGSKIYISVKNLLTFTEYSGFDPEVSRSNPLAAGVDGGIYPQPRTYMIGLNLTF